jgi:hypothetical protein
VSNRRAWWKSFAADTAGELLVAVVTIALFFLIVYLWSSFGS